MEKKKDVYYIEKEIKLNDLDFEFSMNSFFQLNYSREERTKSLEVLFAKKIFGLIKQTFRFPKSTKSHRLDIIVSSFKISSDYEIEPEHNRIMFSNVSGDFVMLFIYRAWYLFSNSERCGLSSSPVLKFITPVQLRELIDCYSNRY